MKSLIRIIALIGLAIAITAHAQSPQDYQSLSLTLSQAISQALENNPALRAAGARVSASEEKIRQAKSGLLPQVFLKETYARTTNPMWAFGTKLNQESITLQDFAPDRLNHPNAADNFNTSIGAYWPIYNGNQTRIGIQQATLNREISLMESARAGHTVIARVAAAYTGVLMARAHLDVVQKSLETARAHLAMIRSRHESGIVVKSDLLRAQVHVSELEQQHLLAENRMEIARSALNTAMGAPLTQSVRLADPLLITETEGEEAAWIEKALQQRPDLSAIRVQEQIAQAEVNKAKAGRMPKLGLLGTYELNSEDFGDSGDSYTLGAVLQLDLYTGNRISAQTREAMANLQAVEAMRNSLELQIRFETRQAFLQTVSAWNRIYVSKKAVAQAEEGLRIVSSRYEAGLFPLVSLLDAELALQQARTNYQKALHDYQSARIQLALASGVINADFK